MDTTSTKLKTIYIAFKLEEYSTYNIQKINFTFPNSICYVNIIDKR